MKTSIKLTQIGDLRVSKLEIKDETVYVIYHKGKPYNGPGRKLVYTSRGAANGVITNDSRDEAKHRHSITRDYLTDIDWYDLDSASREGFIDKVRNEFTVIEYGTKQTKKQGFSPDEIIRKLKDQISSTNLYDRDSYNEGYREALRDMIQVFNSL